MEVSVLFLRQIRRSKGSAETVEHIGTAELPKKPTRKVDKSKGRTPHRDSTFSLRVKYNVYNETTRGGETMCKEIVLLMSNEDGTSVEELSSYDVMLTVFNAHEEMLATQDRPLTQKETNTRVVLKLMLKDTEALIAGK